MIELEIGTEVKLPNFGKNPMNVSMKADMLRFVGNHDVIKSLVYSNRTRELIGYKVVGNEWTWVLTADDVVVDIDYTPNINPHIVDGKAPDLITGFTGGKYPFEELTEHLTEKQDMKDKPAMEEQVGGDHYKTLSIQPMELVLANMGYDAFKGACYVKVNKYMIRNKDNEVGQLKKARHILSMWIEEAEKR